MADKTDSPSGTDFLSAALGASKSVYTGDPAKGPEKSEEPSQIPKEEPDKPTVSLEEEKSKEDTEAVEEEPTDEEPSAEVPPVEEPPETYKTVAEATEAIKQAKRKMTEATTTAKRLEAEKEAAIAERDLYKAKVEQATSKQVTEDISLVLNSGFTKLNALDPLSDTYTQDSVQIWKDMFDAIGPHYATKAVQDGFSAQEQEKKRLKRDADLTEQVVEKAKEAGLDMREGSPESDLFFAVALKSNQHSTVFDEQVEWSIKETQRLRAAFLKLDTETINKGEQHRVERIPLGKGASLVPEKKVEDEAPIGLNQAIQSHQKRL